MKKKIKTEEYLDALRFRIDEFFEKESKKLLFGKFKSPAYLFLEKVRNNIDDISHHWFLEKLSNIKDDRSCLSRLDQLEKIYKQMKKNGQHSVLI